MKLSSRLVITTILIHAIMLAILVWNGGRIIKENQAEQLERTYADGLEYLTETVSIGLVYADRAMLRENISQMESREDFSYAIIYDRHHRIMASSGDIPENISQIKTNISFANAIENGIYHLSSKISKNGQYLGYIQVGFKTDQVKRLTIKSQKQNIAIAILIFLFTLAASILLGRYLTLNLRLLEQGAKQISDGDLDYRIRHSKYDVINDVALAFNSLAENLQVTIDELNEQNRLLAKSEGQVRLLLDSTAEAIYGVDLNGNCTFANQSCVQMLLHKSANSLVGNNMHKLIHHTRLDTTAYPEEECPIYQGIVYRCRYP